LNFWARCFSHFCLELPMWHMCMKTSMIGWGRSHLNENKGREWNAPVYKNPRN
jgi:hypothetical protein